jgi:diguanylate cyclase (GGDEF)-like protein
MKSDQQLYTSLSWGEHQPQAVIQANQCIALRLGHPYQMDAQETGLICGHYQQVEESCSICIPLISHSEIMGVLHIGKTTCQDTHTDHHPMNLAVTVANSISLTLANIRLNQRLREQAIRDPLTGLYNRRFMEESMQRELARAIRLGQPLGIILFDIDHFKNYNDRFGHDAGDRVLNSLGDLVLTRVRSSDIACRYGGEEFLIVLPDTPEEVVLERANQLRQEINHLTLGMSDHLLHQITISAGVAVYPSHSDQVAILVKQADRALYHAKNNGRNRVELAIPTANGA